MDPLGSTPDIEHHTLSKFPLFSSASARRPRRVSQAAGGQHSCTIPPVHTDNPKEISHMHMAHFHTAINSEPRSVPFKQGAYSYFVVCLIVHHMLLVFDFFDLSGRCIIIFAVAFLDLFNTTLLLIFP